MLCRTGRRASPRRRIGSHLRRRSWFGQWWWRRRPIGTTAWPPANPGAFSSVQLNDVSGGPRSIWFASPDARTTPWGVRAAKRTSLKKHPTRQGRPLRPGTYNELLLSGNAACLGLGLGLCLVESCARAVARLGLSYRTDAGNTRIVRPRVSGGHSGPVCPATCTHPTWPRLPRHTRRIRGGATWGAYMRRSGRDPRTPRIRLIFVQCNWPLWWGR